MGRWFMQVNRSQYWLVLNRDPRILKIRPIFDRQKPQSHLSFAPGLHQCLGLHLAEWKEVCLNGDHMSRCVLRLDV